MKDLNSDMETIRNHSIMKNIRQIKNFQRNTGNLKTQSISSSSILYFESINKKKYRYLLFK